MFNRYLYEKLLTESQERQLTHQKSIQMKQKRKSIVLQSSQKYKSKVRNFLVSLASDPINLGSQKPSLQTISSQPYQGIGNSKMIINGFRTSPQHIKQSQQKNSLLDFSPPGLWWGKEPFRQGKKDRQIDKKEMMFNLENIRENRKDNKSLKSKSQSLRTIKLPSIKNEQVEKKTHFKAIQQLGNSIKSINMLKKAMQQTKIDRLGLQNRLMVVMDGKEVVIEKLAMDLLAQSSLVRKRVKSERSFLKPFKSQQLNV